MSDNRRQVDWLTQTREGRTASSSLIVPPLSTLYQMLQSHWREFLEDYPPDLILLDKRMKIAELIGKEPQWRQIYADADCVLFRTDKK